MRQATTLLTAALATLLPTLAAAGTPGVKVSLDPVAPALVSSDVTQPGPYGSLVAVVYPQSYGHQGDVAMSLLPGQGVWASVSIHEQLRMRVEMTDCSKGDVIAFAAEPNVRIDLGGALHTPSMDDVTVRLGTFVTSDGSLFPKRTVLKGAYQEMGTGPLNNSYWAVYDMNGLDPLRMEYQQCLAYADDVMTWWKGGDYAITMEASKVFLGTDRALHRIAPSKTLQVKCGSPLTFDLEMTTEVEVSVGADGKVATPVSLSASIDAVAYLTGSWMGVVGGQKIGGEFGDDNDDYFYGDVQVLGQKSEESPSEAPAGTVAPELQKESDSTTLSKPSFSSAVVE